MKIGYNKNWVYQNRNSYNYLFESKYLIDYKSKRLNLYIGLKNFNVYIFVYFFRKFRLTLNRYSFQIYYKYKWYKIMRFGHNTMDFPVVE